jgi:hypothetical protein
MIKAVKQLWSQYRNYGVSEYAELLKQGDRAARLQAGLKLEHEKLATQRSKDVRAFRETIEQISRDVASNNEQMSLLKTPMRPEFQKSLSEAKQMFKTLRKAHAQLV